MIAREREVGEGLGNFQEDNPEGIRRRDFDGDRVGGYESRQEEKCDGNYRRV